MSAPAGSPGTRQAAGAGRVIAVIAGCVLALIGVTLLAGGVALAIATATLRDGDGYFASSAERFSTPTRALTSEGIAIGSVDAGVADWLADVTGRVRVRATAVDGRPVFVGIAREHDLDRWLRGVAHDEVTDVHSDGAFSYDFVRRVGARMPGAPQAEGIWVASSAGAGTQTVRWDAHGGRWAVVVMNADGSGGVDARVSVGAKAGWVLPVALSLIGVGLLLALAATAVIVAGVSGGPAAGTVATTAGAEPAVVSESRYPVQLEARLDEPLSRWLWLVKWLLALPHWIVLCFLWAAFAVTTVVAWAAIVVTARYPRPIFDFNVGVLRWSWRVSAYATGAIATDRYPPFTLARADYPADLEIPYPEHLSRGLALVKTWLLAIPHYLILAVLVGGGVSAWTWGETQVELPGVLGILVLVAGFVLLFTGRYPREVFRLVVGINRWLYRVLAYAALMRDEYPPFRLEP
jgi:hypothetical protein